MLSIKTDRLILRDHLEEDLPSYHRWISDPRVMRYVQGFPRARSLEESAESLNDTITSSACEPRRKYFIAITLAETGAYLGSGGGAISHVGGDGGVMVLGYFLLPEYWGHGYAAEATRAWIDYSFSDLSIHRVVASCDAANTASERIMQKCGMTLEARFVKHRYCEESWHDGLYYALLREEVV